MSNCCGADILQDRCSDCMEVCEAALYVIFFPATDSTPGGSILLDRSGRLSNENTDESEYMTFYTEDEAQAVLDENPEWIRGKVIEWN